MSEILPNPFTDPKKLPKRSLFDRPESEKDEKQSFIDQAMAKGLEAAQESMKKKFSDPELQKIWDEIEVKIESGEIKLHEIIIGGKPKDQLINEIEAAGMKIGDAAKQMMESKYFHTSEEENDLELIELSVANLGFPSGATTKQIYDRVKELKLELAPAEAGPQLRIQFNNQPRGEYVLIGMDPIKDSSGSLRVFDVYHVDDGRGLSDDDAYPGAHWDGHDRWVFRRK